MSGLPVAAPGQNPYSLYLAQAKQAFYRDPTPGFRDRLIALFAVNGFVILAGLCYFVVLVVDARRRGNGRLWLFRLVRRPSGRYIATNQNLWTAVMSVVSGTIILGALQDGYFIYLYQTAQNHTAAWRSLSFIPLFIHGWLVSWALLQAFLLTPDQHYSRYLSATVANSMFVGIGSALTIGLFVSAVISSMAGSSLWYSYVDLRTILETLESQYAANNVNSSDLVQLLPTYQIFLDKASYYTVSSRAETGLLCTVPLLTLLINMGSLGLARVLRRQININLSQFRSPSMFTDMLDSNELLGMELVKNPSPPTMGSRLAIHSGSLERSFQPSRSEIRQIASLQENGVEGERAKHIMILQKAERDLVVISSCLVAISAACAAITIWITVNVNRGTIQGNSWPTLEFALFGVVWIYATALALALILLIHNTYTHLSKRQEERIATVYVGGSTSVLSLQAMLGHPVPKEPTKSTATNESSPTGTTVAMTTVVRTTSVSTPLIYNSRSHSDIGMVRAEKGRVDA